MGKCGGAGGIYIRGWNGAWSRQRSEMKNPKTTTNAQRERDRERGENMHMNLVSIPHKSPGLKNAMEILKIRNDFHFFFNEK